MCGATPIEMDVVCSGVSCDFVENEIYATEGILELEVTLTRIDNGDQHTEYIGPITVAQPDRFELSCDWLSWDGIVGPCSEPAPAGADLTGWVAIVRPSFLRFHEFGVSARHPRARERRTVWLVLRFVGIRWRSVYICRGKRTRREPIHIFIRHMERNGHHTGPVNPLASRRDGGALVVRPSKSVYKKEFFGLSRWDDVMKHVWLVAIIGLTGCTRMDDARGELPERTVAALKPCAKAPAWLNKAPCEKDGAVFVSGGHMLSSKNSEPGVMGGYLVNPALEVILKEVARFPLAESSSRCGASRVFMRGCAKTSGPRGSMCWGEPRT